MTTKMKLALALLAMILVPGARAQTNAYAYGYFNAPDGRLALVNLVRTRDLTTNVTTTQLFYTFCGQAQVIVSCQRGDGVIPNSAVQGTVFYDRTKPDVMRVTVDTSAVAGYRNQLCTQGVDYADDCLGEVVATGGQIVVTWTRTQEWANLYTSSANSYQQGKLTASATSKQGVFSAAQVGTVLGVNAATANTAMITSTDSASLQAQFKARKVAAVRVGGVK